MKRKLSSLQSLQSFQCMKRAGSSLFSIATILVEGDDHDPNVSCNNLFGACKEITALPPIMASSKPAMATVVSSAPPTDTEASCTSDGFYIGGDDDEDDNDNDYVSSNVVLASATGGALVVANETVKSKAYNRTGVIFEAGEGHYDRYNRYHKERPLRITSVQKHLEEANDLKERCCIFGDFDEADADKIEETAFLDDDDFLRVHLPGYMKRLDRLSNCSCCAKLDREAEQYKSIYFTDNSVTAAKTAATSLCRLVKYVMTNQLDNGFAVIRPPGHHAEPSFAGGYCIINNVAVAAKYAQERLEAKKVLIVDWDVHHGNGTQSIFLNDPNVLYFSVHRYHGGNFYPFLNNGGPSTIGSSSAPGFNINVAWNKKNMGNDEYFAVWKTILMPVAREFQPDLVIVSAGFDAAAGDMGECNVTPEGFGLLTRMLMTLAGGKVVCALEGGYVRSVLGRCVESVVKSLLGNEQEGDMVEENEMCISSLQEYNNILEAINNSAANSIRSTIGFHQPYWDCLNCCQDENPKEQDKNIAEEKKVE